MFPLCAVLPAVSLQDRQGGCAETAERAVCLRPEFGSSASAADMSVKVHVGADGCVVLSGVGPGRDLPLGRASGALPGPGRMERHNALRL